MTTRKIVVCRDCHGVYRDASSDDWRCAECGHSGYSIVEYCGSYQEAWQHALADRDREREADACVCVDSMMSGEDVSPMDYPDPVRRIIECKLANIQAQRDDEKAEQLALRWARGI